MLEVMLTFLFDLDGVIYRDRSPLPGAAETVAALRTAGHRVLFATNNATRERAAFLALLREVGVEARIDELGTSASVTASYLRGLPQPPATALVVGAGALRQELLDAGIRVVDEHPDCVVVGLDREFSYRTLASAQQAILDGALLVATNRDPQFPGADRIWPGAGSIVAAVETAAQCQATAIGKPGPLLYQTLLEAAGADPRCAVAVGDNLLTDIAAANAMDLPSVLVLTGVSRRDDLATSPFKPSLVVDTLPQLLDHDLQALVERKG
jgi:HAD superfamily hydrolase (TIGR01450 family)